ncbi:Phosphatidylserine/phosphatidylglycerophosphate/cardiolipin synthase [Mycolicibacterium rutilum]|uniref:Phosphatidylserine/phosphatidylglycerophosphate/cardiolipin synthase n=1 Tax=Mycolicibacterium rutilum TaxID=370526 RepID=A0A1H6KJG4_MYCRU|nr:phospholipase D-like domain-containing protein [Mycolicibacterium rutilum]SEH75742.1 Phosphatidylserine/phosphatidylglycerophosphate/cardiolipin synthase [Mycolicibacterium rutilum]
MSVLAEWFLTSRERGNPSWELPAWSEGNQAEALIHGAAYFDRLVTEVETLGPGDHLFFADWRGDADQRLRDAGPTVAELFRSAAERGVQVKGLMWRSYPNRLQFNEEQNRHLAEAIERAGGEVLLDQRVLLGGSHHQRLVLLRHPRTPRRDVAFIGGIDLCHSRRDDASHRGDPQAIQMSQRYGERPPWHDVQLQVRGPVVGALDQTFRERWTARAPLNLFNPFEWLRDRFQGDAARPELPEQPPDPPPCGPHAVQVLRTYGDALIQYEFAKEGERSIARGYTKAVRRARRLIYLEDQYLWSEEVADLLVGALEANPGLHLVAVVPRHFDLEGGLGRPPTLVGRELALGACRRAAPDRVHVFDVENHEGTPVYVHSKVCVIDDTWACIGSDNFNRRSWTHDSELSCAVLDADGGFARDLRLRLLREHLDRADDGSEDGGLADLDTAVDEVVAGAEQLEAWHASGREGARPPGRLRPHSVERVDPWTRLWAEPAYRVLFDPDGRSYRDRLLGRRP